MHTPAQTRAYQVLRGNLAIPAGHALRMLREQAALTARMEAAGFLWQENRQGGLSARWEQDGFDLFAVVVEDEDGWWTSGVDFIGRFSSRWTPGAIRHHQGGGNAHPWFIPAGLGNLREEYRRACAYGHGWWYVGVKAQASRAGVALGEASLFGIEWDGQSDRQYLTETAFELASQAIHEARGKLKLLCGCH